MQWLQSHFQIFYLFCNAPYSRLYCIFVAGMKQKLTFIIYFFCLWLAIPAWAQDIFGDQEGMPSGNYDDQDDPNRFIWGRDTTSAGGKEFPIGSFCWKIDERFGNVLPAESDTLPDNFQNFNLTDGMTGQYNFLGNLGSPRLSRLFMDRKPYSNFIFAEPFDYFYTPVSDFLFTNTKSPITNLSYHSCGNKQNGEDRIRAYFASNINKISGIGFKIDYLYGRGYYNNQATSLFNGSLYGYYLDDRYNMHAWISVNHMRLGENGGIEDDTYITHPEEFTRSYGSRDIPTVLSENWNRNEDQTYYLTHRYNLGVYKDAELPDSLKPVIPEDSVLLKSLTDSIRQIVLADTMRTRIAIDSLRKEFLASVEHPQEFVPVTSFIHTLRIRNAKHTVYSYNTPENYYTNHYYGDANDMADRTRGYAIKNTLGISLREGFNKWAKAGLTAFASHEYRHFTLPDLMGETPIVKGYSENNISVGGELNKRMGKTLHYDVTGEVVLLGEDIGQFDVEGKADLNFRLFKDTVQLAARAFIKNQNPSFYMRHYHSQFAWWDNSLDKEFRTRIEGTLSLKRTRTSLTAGVENIKNYAYFATDKTAYYNATGEEVAGYSNAISVKQYGNSVQVLSARLNQDFKFSVFRWENEVAFQKSSNEDILPLPTISVYSNLYLVFRIAKVLRVQLGGDVRFFTEYYAPDYAPIIQQFTVQSPENRIKLGNYPICNVYANLHLKHCRIYVAYNHANAGGGNAFLVPHYPINPARFCFGLSWNFFN